MKHVLFCCLLSMVTFFTNAQTSDPVPPYKKEPQVVPPFTLLLADSTTFTKKDLPKKKFIVITYFNPECGHCQDEAKELAKHIGSYNKAFFVMAANKEIDMIRDFSEDFGLSGHRNLKIGKDTQYFLPVYFAVKSTPFTAVYDKKGKLVASFENGYTISQLEKIIQ